MATKNPREDAERRLDEALETGALTVEDLEEAKVASLRSATGKAAKTVGGAGQADGVETTTENPLLTKWRAEYKALTGQKPAWEFVATKLTPDVLAKAANLEDAKIYGFNKNGELCIGDGRSEVPEETLNQYYSTIRNATHAKGLSLVRRDEYELFNKGNFELRTVTWLESGDDPSGALNAYWHSGFVFVYENDPDRRRGDRGARRLLRVKIS